MEEDKTLNTEFAGKTRKLVFWYDEKGEFAEDIDAGNAKIYKLKKGNQNDVEMFRHEVIYVSDSIKFTCKMRIL